MIGACPPHLRPELPVCDTVTGHLARQLFDLIATDIRHRQERWLPVAARDFILRSLASDLLVNVTRDARGVHQVPQPPGFNLAWLEDQLLDAERGLDYIMATHAPLTTTAGTVLREQLSGLRSTVVRMLIRLQRRTI